MANTLTTLNQILSVVTRIEQNQSSNNTGGVGAGTQQPQQAQPNGSSTNSGTDNTLGDVAKSISTLSVGIAGLATSTLKFSLIPGKSSVITFINDIVKVTNKGKTDNINASAKAISAVSGVLPVITNHALKMSIFQRMGVFKDVGDGIKLLLAPFNTKAKNTADVISAQSRVLQAISSFTKNVSKDITQFAKLQSSGKIKLAAKGISTYIKAVTGITSSLGPSKIKSLQSAGVALNLIASSISRSLIGLATGIVVFSGMIVLASMGMGMLTGTGAVGGGLIIFSVIGASLLFIGGVFALMGYMDKKMGRGSKSINGMGQTLKDLALGVMVFAGVYYVASQVAGVSFAGLAALVAGSILIPAAAFWILGNGSEKIAEGHKAVQGMGKSLLWMAGATLAYFGVYKLIDMIGIGDTGSMLKVGGLVALSLLVPSAAFWLLGKASGDVDKGSKSLAMMGGSILIFSLSLLGTAYVFKHLDDTITAPGGIGYMGLVGGIAAIVIGMAGVSLMFNMMGKNFMGIAKGVGSLLLMGIGIMFFSMSLKTIGTSISSLMHTSAFTWGVDPNDNSNGWWGKLLPVLGSVAIYAGMMALTAGAFTLLGGLIAPIGIGFGAVALLSLGLIAFSTGLQNIDSTLSSINLKELGPNLATGISSFVGGVYEGITKGLGISGGFSFDGLKSLAKAAGKVGIIFTGMGLLTAMSLGLSAFAYALKAFRNAGIFDHVEYDKDGNAIVKQSGINLVDVSKNISSSIAIFFQTISDTFSDPNKIPDTKKMSELTSVLLGSKAKVLGLSLYSKPGLLDALNQFGDMIQKFGGKNGKFDIYDPKGKLINSVSPSEVVSNIMGGVSTFFNEMGKIADIYGESSMQEKLCNIAVLLLGEENFKIQFGSWFKVSDKKVGILEPVIKFAEVVKLLSEGYYIDPITNEKQRLEMDGAKIAEKVISFASAFSAGVKDAVFDTSGVDSFNNFIEVLSEKSDPLEKVAKSIDSLASSTERLYAALKNLSQAQLNALFSMSNQATGGHSMVQPTQHSNNSPISVQQGPNMVPSAQNGGVSGGNVIDRDMSDQIGTAVARALVGKSFDFKFTNKSGGQITLG